MATSMALQSASGAGPRPRVGFTAEQQLMYEVLGDIFELLISYEVLTDKELSYLLSGRSRGKRDGLQLLIAERLHNITTANFSPRLFDPWNASFYQSNSIGHLINKRDFWEAPMPGRIRAMRGALTGILRKYRDIQTRR